MVHLIHSSILAVILYLFYRLLIKGSQGFQTHRFYLLAIPVVSALLPLLVVPADFGLTRETVFKPITMMEMPVMIDSNLQQTVIATPDPIDFTMIIGTIYLVGMGIALFLFFYKLAQVQQWKDDGVTTYDDGCYITKVHNLSSAFSFLNHIYLNSAFAKAEFDQILAHEKVHVKQKHSWDLLFYELLRILFWFHPVAYLGQRDLKLVHEFIADEQTIAIHGKKS